MGNAVSGRRGRYALILFAVTLLLASLPAAGAKPTKPPAAEDSVELQTITVLATVRDAPPRITLDWLGVADAGGFTIYRKPMEAGSWGDVYATLAADATGFQDDNVAVGVGYEYKVQTIRKWESSDGESPAVGHVYSGIALPPADDRGTVLLLVDETIAASLTGEIARLEQDLIGDGWVVLRREVARQITVNAPGKPAEIEPVKAIIREAYKKSPPSTLRAVFLLGRVPIPYSGWLSPDGHGDTPRVADPYYSMPDETWTDVRDYGAGNVVGDGLYDQSQFQSAKVKVAVGRVDMSGLPFFGASEPELLRRYLNKLHAYRHRRTVFQPLGGVGSGGLVGCRTAYTLKTLFHRNMARVAGLDSQWGGEFLVPSLWRYQEGLAYNLNALGEKLADRAPQYVFTGCWGSGVINYDEDAEGGRLTVGRAFLAGDGAGLDWVCGVPDRHFHWMAMGETIGNCERLCMANGALYPSGANGNFHDSVIRGLLGDPTLRMHVLAPPVGLSIADGKLAWEASPEAGTTGFQGYHIYRAPTRAGPFLRLTTQPVPGTSWTDPSLPAEAVYQVRAIRLERTSTGSYYNNSQGLFVCRHAVSIVPEFFWVSVPEGIITKLRVRLSSAPAVAATVKVSMTAGNTNITVRSGASLAFTPADWRTWQTVTLGAARGGDAGEVSGMIGLTASGLIGAQVGVVRPASAIQVSSQSLSLPAAGTASLLVRLSSPPSDGQPVTVKMQRVSKTEVNGGVTILSGESLQFTRDDWDVWRTVTLICDDSGAANPSNPSVDFELSAPGYRRVTVSVGTWVDAGEDEVELTACAGLGGASVNPLGVTIVSRGASVPLTATAAPGFRFFRWVATRGPVTFADASSAKTTVAVSGPARLMAVFERGDAVPDEVESVGNHAPIIADVARADAPVVPLTGTKVRVVAKDPDGDPLSYTWSLAVGAGSAAFFTPKAAESAVSFSAVGTYVLRVMVRDGRGGHVAGETSVVAVTPPAFARQPSDAAALAGRSVKLGVRATGAFLSYQWLKNGRALSLMTNRVCLVPPVVAADNGAAFTVEVRNPAGIVRSRVATLTILGDSPGTGLDGEYFKNTDFSNLMTLRTDPGLHGDIGRPDDLSAPYSVRWTGKLLAPYSETFDFSVHNGTSGGKLWINGRRLCEGGKLRDGGSIALVAGKKYNVNLELVCNREDTAYFQWDSETFEFLLGKDGYPSVPAEFLYSEGGESQPPAPSRAGSLPELP